MIVAVVGAAGAVGSSVAARLVEYPQLESVLLHDTDDPAVRVTAMDLTPVAASYGVAVRTVEAFELSAANVLVFCAALRHTAGVQRAAMFAGNVTIVDGVLAQLSAVNPGWSGLLVMTSNPIDALVHRASAILSDAMVVGYAQNDTLRLRQEISRMLHLDSTASLDACWLGAHGGGGVAAWSAATNIDLDAAQRARIENRIRSWYDEWQQYGTSRTTAASTAHGIARLIDAYLGLRPATMVLSTDASAYDAPGVPVGLPVRITRGSMRVQRWRLSENESTSLRADVEFVRSMCFPVADLRSTLQ